MQNTSKLTHARVIDEANFYMYYRCAPESFGADDQEPLAQWGTSCPTSSEEGHPGTPTQKSSYAMGQSSCSMDQTAVE